MKTLHKAIRDDEKEWPSVDQDAFFESLFHTYYKTLCRFSFRIVQDKDKAEDVVQNCFINLWEKKDSTNIQSSFKSYLYRSVYNRSINEYTRTKKINKEDISVLNDVVSSTSDDPELILQAKEVQVKIDQAIAEMPEGCRTIFLLSREEQLSYKEIAETLEISVKTVENQMGKALRILREHLFYLILTLCFMDGMEEIFLP